jgi:hypothetical protein
VPQKPSESEEEYFARIEFEKRKAIAAERARTMAVSERDRLKELHFMHCPKCGQDLVTISMHGVQVDQCGGCGGMFLDAGELDELIQSDDSGAVKRFFGMFKGK